eukprot:TRINITY_DN14214_c0_g1_i1.p1 TRINITY_DN14214_c0_g1~~TRINITY_DN14214_c0_g1_i1.p1  ORF type:complete len:501 (+),score=134.30 TRINITY_DN14214_c0_g1_i1:148-1650(+)
MQNKQNFDAIDKKLIRFYCTSCRMYISSEGCVTEHMGHEFTDLAEKSAHFLAEYQRLSRIATLLSERRQIHIKDASIGDIMADIRTRVIQAKENLASDANKTIKANAENLMKNAVVEEMHRVKKELAGKDDERLGKVRDELCKIAKDLLIEISGNRYENADKLINPQRLTEYENTMKELTEKASNDVKFIKEIRNLKDTKVEYSYNPLAVMGMIHVRSLISKPKRVLQFDRQKNLVNSYNVEGKKCYSTKVSAGFILPFRFVTLEAFNNVYFNGGDNDHSVYLKSHYLFDELCGSLVPLADMNESRSRHALAYVESNRSIYALGGENSNGLLNHCEYYDIEKNTWTEIESLNEKRCNLSICSVDAVLYAIGGWNQDYLNIIERLNVSRKGKWEVVNVGKKEMKPGQLIGAIGIKSEEILIFGGYQVEEMLTKDCYVLNLRQSVLSKKESLREADAFIASEVKKIGDVIYAFGYAKGGIHSYDIRKDEWTWIPQGDLVFRE